MSIYQDGDMVATNTPSRARPSFLSEAIADLRYEFKYKAGSTVQITKAQAGAILEALDTEPRAGDGDALMVDLLDCENAMRGANTLTPETVERTQAWSVVAAYCLAFVSDHLPELKRRLAAQRNEGDV